MTRPEIFKASIADIDDIVCLNYEAFKDDDKKYYSQGLRVYSGESRLAWTWDKIYISKTINENRYVLKLDNKLIGAFHFIRMKRYLYLSSIAVFSKYRGHGYARQIMQFLDLIARDLKYKEIQLESRQHNSGFYMKLGYCSCSKMSDNGYTTYKKKLDFRK